LKALGDSTRKSVIEHAWQDGGLLSQGFEELYGNEGVIEMAQKIKKMETEANERSQEISKLKSQLKKIYKKVR
jgi:hypothetical protein